MHFTLDVLSNTRQLLKKTIENNTLEVLNKVPEGFNNNVIWNIGHVLVTEQLLVYKLSGLSMSVSAALVDKYKKGTKPEGDVSQEDVNEIKTLLISTIEDTKENYKKEVFKAYQEYTVSTTGNTLTNVNDALQFVQCHEGMHMGYILALLRVVKN